MNCVKVKDLYLDEIPKICVTITGITDYQILNDIKHLKNYDFDLIELRIDYYENVEDYNKVIELLKQIKVVSEKPILFTFRTNGEGGMHEMSEEKYFLLNQNIIKSGFVDLIDIELFSNEKSIKDIISLAKNKDVKVIMSNHEFSKTPSKEEIISRLVKMQGYGADITKIVVLPNSEEDVLTLMSAAVEMKKEKADRPFITIAMGSLGIVTRLAGNLLGSCITFTTLNKPSALGQINVKNAREILNLINS